MAVVNRTLDSSQQRFVIAAKAGAVVTGATGIIGLVETPSTLDAAQIAAFGVSGAPSYQLTIGRFIAGTGYTAIVVATGTSNTPPDFGVSGVPAAGMVMVASGSTLRNLLANDILMYTSGGANSAVTGLNISLVLRPIQDIKQYFGGLV